MNNIFLTYIQSFILTVCILSVLSVTAAQVRTSSSYQLQSDSVNFAGGLSTSTSYSLESTAGEIATGISTSSSYSLKAGYQQMQEVTISMTAIDPVVMSPNLGGITGGVSNGTTSVSVTTDSPSGYSLTIVADSSPAMRKGADTISDYVSTSTPLTCWEGLSTSSITIAQGLTNHPGGATTTLHFRVGIGSAAVVTAGDYIATTTLTALPL